MEVGDELKAPAALPPEKETRYPFNRRLGVSQSPSERYCRKENLLPMPGFENQTVQSIASRYPNPRDKRTRVHKLHLFRK
jgi:hypothetical protein